MNTPDTLHYLQWSLEALALFGPIFFLGWLTWRVAR
jgi:hypothetical protein